MCYYHSIDLAELAFNKEGIAKRLRVQSAMIDLSYENERSFEMETVSDQFSEGRWSSTVVSLRHCIAAFDGFMRTAANRCSEMGRTIEKGKRSRALVIWKVVVCSLAACH